jgi:hypothetical protein
VFKAIGYSISSVSVLLLGFASYDGIKDKPALLACLILGAGASILGMLFRWSSFLREEKPSQSPATASQKAKLEKATRPAPAPDRGSEARRPTGR